MASTVEMNRGSSAGRKPTIGMSRMLASSSSDPYDWVKACLRSLQPHRSTWALISSRNSRQRSTGPSRPNSSWIRTARSKATQAIIFLLPIVGQPGQEPLEQRPAEVRAFHALHQRLIGRVQHLTVDVELTLVRRGVAHSNRLRVGEPWQPGDDPLLDAALAGHAVHDLHLAGVTRQCAQEPLAPGQCLVAVAGAEHGEKGQAGVAKPAVA